MGGAFSGVAGVADSAGRLEWFMPNRSERVDIAEASQFHPWDAMAPAALEAIERRGPFVATAETGCGGSTILLSRESGLHTVFAIEGVDRTISNLRQHPQLRGEAVTFVEGETKNTLPAHHFSSPLDLVLLDGPHAYPLPQVEFAYLFPRVKPGGWIVLDDIQIPSVHALFQFLRAESSVLLEEVCVRTAFFRKVADPKPEPDGWQKQGINRGLVLRYSWRDRLRAVVPAILKKKARIGL